MVDACGAHRHSGFFFKWAALSVLNDDPPLDTIPHVDEYITCFDAISEAVHAVDPELKTMGPEQWPSTSNIDYYKHFMNGSNHKDGKPPQLISAHHVSHHEDHCEPRTLLRILQGKEFSLFRLSQPVRMNARKGLIFRAGEKNESLKACSVCSAQTSRGFRPWTRGWRTQAGRWRPTVRRSRRTPRCTTTNGQSPRAVC